MELNWVFFLAAVRDTDESSSSEAGSSSAGVAIMVRKGIGIRVCPNVTGSSRMAAAIVSIVA